MIHPKSFYAIRKPLSVYWSYHILVVFPPQEVGIRFDIETPFLGGTNLVPTSQSEWTPHKQFQKAQEFIANMKRKAAK